jgi:hypothetical protein
MPNEEEYLGPPGSGLCGMLVISPLKQIQYSVHFTEGMSMRLQNRLDCFMKNTGSYDNAYIKYLEAHMEIS